MIKKKCAFISLNINIVYKKSGCLRFKEYLGQLLFSLKSYFKIWFFIKSIYYSFRLDGIHQWKNWTVGLW